MKPSPIPAGAYREVTLEAIDDGAAIQEVTEALREGMRKLAQYEQITHNHQGKVSISLNLVLRRQPKTDTFGDISWSVDLKVPKIQRGGVVKIVGDRLLCQAADGVARSNPDQIPLWDHKMRPIGVVDTNTGELVPAEEEPATSLRLPPQSAQA